MTYLILFLEGILTFISPCLLPLIPIYLVYLAGDTREDNQKSRVIINSLAFVLGFTLIFVALGAFAGTIGSFLKQHIQFFNIIAGVFVIVLGLNFLGVINLKFLNQRQQKKVKTKDLRFLTSFLFGLVFAISFTPCASAFLGSALFLASEQGSTLEGVFLLLAYSLGLGIPFVLSAILIDKLQTTFDFIKKHYKIINRISGLFLIVIGILMATGLLGMFLNILTF